MIIVRSPLRISLGGGGTDVPSYYRRRGMGALTAAAIDKYVYITVHETFDQSLILKYSKMERVAQASEVQHPLIREALVSLGLEEPHLEITSMADIPAGTGLGSSGSFATALLQALHAHQKNLVHPDELAAQACDIEINRLREPVGKQDQYISAYGGVTCFRFHDNESVEAFPLPIHSETLYTLEENLLLFFTQQYRSAGAILKDQDDKTRQGEEAMLANLDFIRELGLESEKALVAGDLRKFAELMDVHCEHKRKRSNGISNQQIDSWYELAKGNGALGGKLIGAGGGGFLLFYSEDKARLRRAMAGAGLREIRFRFDFEGTKVLVQ